MAVLHALLPLLAAVVLLLCATPRATLACTTVIVGRDATTDGSVLIARNDDGEDARTDTNKLLYHPPRDTPAPYKSNGNRLEIELPAPGLAYMALPIVLPDPEAGVNASGESSGVNSAGVAISGTESVYNSEAALAADPYVPETGIIEDVIPSVILPQATSAREGMALLGSLVEERGTGEGFGVMIADAKEAWYIETASGHHWLAMRVPDDSFFVSGNQGRFQEVDWEDKENVMYSRGLKRFLQRAGLYDPASGKPFNFQKAVMRHAPGDAHYSHPRIRVMQQLLTGARKAREAMPVFLQPKHGGLQAQDVMAVMRNHFDYTRHDPYTRQNPAERWRPIAVLRSGNGHVIRLRPVSDGLPEELSAIEYLAQAMPALSPYIPLYMRGLAGEQLPRELTQASSEPDPVSLFWKARRLQALVMQDFPKLAPGAAAAIHAFEEDAEARQRPAFEKEYLCLVQAGDKSAAQDKLVAFTRSVVQQAGSLLEGLTQEAAEQLGLQQVPPDTELVRLLDEAAEAYNFLPKEVAAGELRHVQQQVAGDVIKQLTQQAAVLKAEV